MSDNPQPITARDAGWILLLCLVGPGIAAFSLAMGFRVANWILFPNAN